LKIFHRKPRWERKGATLFRSVSIFLAALVLLLAGIFIGNAGASFKKESEPARPHLHHEIPGRVDTEDLLGRSFSTVSVSASRHRRDGKNLRLCNSSAISAVKSRPRFALDRMVPVNNLRCRLLRFC
jgi:hypothetical protein